MDKSQETMYERKLFSTRVPGAKNVLFALRSNQSASPINDCVCVKRIKATTTTTTAVSSGRYDL